MRILLRQQATGLYLQPGGQWSSNRESAREFLDAALAYWWAIEQRLLGTEILLAFTDPVKDFVTIKVRSDRAESDRPVVNCQESDWQQKLHFYLYRYQEVDLISFDYEVHGPSCELIAQAFSMQFQLDRVPTAKAAHFRKKPGWSGNARLSQS